MMELEVVCVYGVGGKGFILFYSRIAGSRDVYPGRSRAAQMTPGNIVLLSRVPPLRDYTFMHEQPQFFYRFSSLASLRGSGAWFQKTDKGVSSARECIHDCCYMLHDVRVPRSLQS